MNYKLCTILTASLLLLAACSGGQRDRMHDELLRARKMNKEYVDFTTDSVMKEVAVWYDRHGTPNERMEAHYLLGCTYRDMGEAPRAVDCYLDAAACADTTAADCDFHTLGCVYSQMANLYHKQLLLSYEIDSEKQSSQYFFLAKDTANAIFEMKMVAGAMILLNKEDSAEIVLNNAIGLYHEHGYLQEELQTSIMLMHLYSKQPHRVNELKQLIDRYDSECIYFDSLRLLPPSLRQYYSYKGNYFESIDQLDSAEYYYRIIYRSKMKPVDKNPMYKGLLSVFKKRHIADSIAKYARLFCEVNDSSIAIKDQELTAQMAASYNYSRYQKEAQENERRAYKANIRLLIVSLSLLAIAAFTAVLIYHYRRQKRKQQAAYNSTIAERARLQEELNSLKAKDYDAVIARKEEEIDHLTTTIAKHEAAFRDVMLNDKLSAFEESSIVKLFSEKSAFRKGGSDITASEWEELEREFRQDMPSAYSLLKDLSTLQLQVCILLLLDYDETVIANMKNTKPQTITNAKARANIKLFQTGDAGSFKTNLKRLIMV